LRRWALVVQMANMSLKQVYRGARCRCHARLGDDQIPLHGYPRYDSPFIQTARGEQVYRVKCGEFRHEIDLPGLVVRPVRKMS
jgi:hypothetical protein